MLNANQKRLAAIVDKIVDKQSPDNWQCLGTTAVGGLQALGFSRLHACLLVVSGTGRGLFDCQTGEKIARQQEDSVNDLNEYQLTCQGIGIIENELLSVAGLYGGGLPSGNIFGESIKITSLEWPVSDVYFCQNYKSALIDGDQKYCIKLYSDYLLTCGFSWCGRFLVIATSSDFTLWRKL